MLINSKDFDSGISSVGVDKIHFFTQDFKVTDTLNLNIQPNRKKAGEDYIEATSLFEVGDECIMAEKAYANQDKFGMTIDKYGLHVNLNPSKFYHPYMLNSDMKQIDLAVSHVEKELSNIGVHFSPKHSRISRVDLAKQFQVDKPIINYSDMFRMLKAKRSNSIAYPTASTWRNKSIQAQCYDKGVELMSMSNDRVMSQLHSSHFMRAEIRYTTGPSLSRHLKRNSYAEFVKMQPEEINERYIHHWKDNVFRVRPKEQLTIDFDNHLDTLKAYKEKYPRGGFDKFLQVLSLDNILSTYGNLETLRYLLIEAGYARQYSYKAVDNLKDLLAQKAEFDRTNKRVTTMTLYNEVLDKICA
jgi:hypothetical protein